MNLQALPQALIVCSALALAAAGCATPEGATPAVKDGLVPVHSANVDELYLRLNADLSGYRRGFIEPGGGRVPAAWAAPPRGPNTHPSPPRRPSPPRASAPHATSPRPA